MRRGNGFIRENSLRPLGVKTPGDFSAETDRKQAPGGEEGREALAAGVLFYQAGRTGALEALAVSFFKRLGVPLTGAAALPEESALPPGLDGMLRGRNLLLVFSSALEGRPVAAEPLLRAMGAKFSPEGEPEGVLPLPGKRLTGYLPESARKAVCLLPDDVEEAGAMLEAAVPRLVKKFSLAFREEEKADLDVEAQRASLKELFGEAGSPVRPGR